MQYLTMYDVLGINEFVIAQEGQQSLLRDVGGLEAATGRLEAWIQARLRPQS
jgi:hypothetical protein